MFWKIKSSVVFAVIMLYALLFYGFLQAAWLGSRMARKRGFAINS